MKRAALGLALVVCFALPRAEARGYTRRVALTFDDLPGNYLGYSCHVDVYRRLNEQLVAALKRNHAPAIGFVNERNLCGDKSSLEIWLDAGLDLGNHTYSHLDLNTNSLATFENDLLKGEAVTRPLLASRGKTLRYFRFPFLHMGKNLAKKRGIESFLREHGYENGVVTMDNNDYIYAVVYSRADAATKKKVADDYIRYMDSIFAFYEKYSVEILGREPAQILLLHDHQLNADTLDRLTAMMRKRGYTLISIEEALRDPVYKKSDDYIGGDGLSWIRRWSKDPAKVPAGEPEVSPWIMRAFQQR